MKNLDFAKLSIWLCLLLSAVGGGAHWYLKRRIDATEDNRKKALTQLRAITQTRKDIRVLQDEIEADSFINASRRDFGAFLEGVALNDAKLGMRPNLSQRRDSTPPGVPDYTDTDIELSWGRERGSRKNLTFDRERIAAFLWFVENKTNLLKVTKLELKTEGKGGPESRDDQWELRCWITERAPKRVTATP